MPAEEIDPIYFERTYYLGPADKTGEPVYALLVEAMEQAGLVAVATYVFHERENLGCLRVRDGVLTLEKMFFADEVRPIEGIAPGRRQGRQEAAGDGDRADQELHRRRSSPTSTRTTYRERLMGVIEQKRNGEDVKRVVETETPPRPTCWPRCRRRWTRSRSRPRRRARPSRPLRQPLAAAEQRRREVAEPADPLEHGLHRERRGSSSGVSSSQRSGVDTVAPGCGRTE